MEYLSTRNKSVKVAASQAIVKGISDEGGLFVPVQFPEINIDKLKELATLGYKERAKYVLSLYLTDFTKQELDYCVEGAYADGKFSSTEIAPLYNLKDSFVQELWRGPTCAFKDMALQLLPYLLTVSASKSAKDKKIVILVATSGDTGKAALEGFKDVKNTKILVFYPNDGVSPMQKLQMTTQEGENVSVCAIKGNFDDAQSGVKSIFTNKEIAEKLAENNMQFSSANSINWGRLVPQIVYYISAYCDLMKNGKINAGDKINIVVPTGNFGNILAAYYAKQMGLPVNKFICASNKNNVLTDFIKTGEYDKNREFYTTSSPSMDILISSNLERLLFEIFEKNDEEVKKCMTSLSENGKYVIPKDVHQRLLEDFDAGCCDDTQTLETIKETYEKENYLLDTHTAVAVKVFNEYVDKTGDKTPTVIASTANPYKFSKSVLCAIAPDEKVEDEFDTVDAISRISGVECPTQLATLKGKKPRFTQICEKSEMVEVVFNMLGI